MYVYEKNRDEYGDTEKCNETRKIKEEYAGKKISAEM
jgi:hypothetical protein